jgi:Ig-like domain CHU_C associated/Secretion system C-terminal sorting domain
MKKFYPLRINKTSILLLLIALLSCTTYTNAQNATVAIPVGIGHQCSGGGTRDSVKFFNYNANTNVLTHRLNCMPILTGGIGTSGAPATSFTQNAATVTFSPFDGNLYYTEIKTTAPITSYTYRWPANTCPSVALAPYKTFPNQFVASVEFDAATGLGYQINFVDTTGMPSVNPDPAAGVGQYNSGAVVNGNPAVAYYDATAQRLKYVRALEPSGASWGVPVFITAAGVNVGQYTSLVIVNGNPAISYYDVTNGDLKYVRATDVTGTVWGAPVTVDGLAANVGQYTSLAIVNGNPAISYYDITNTDLKYVRAADVNGAAWGIPVAAEVSAGNVGQYTSLAVVNGNPAISYYDVSTADLKYIRASNASGTAWGPIVLVDASASNVGQFTSLKIINGNPAISYYDATGQDLKYARASDISGVAWAAPVAVTTASNIGQYTSLTVVNGNPAISYYDASASDLKYVRATDASGAVWAAPVTPEATGNVGQYSFLMVVSGYPAIFYYDATGTKIKYIRAGDVNGAFWYKNTGIYKMELQQIDFTTGTLGISRPINFGPRYIYRQEGDMIMTPSGQLLAAFNNKYFTINWKDYATANPIVGTFIDTLKLGANNNMVGLAYSDGKLVGAIQNSSASCSSSYKEIDILTGAQSAITYSAGSPLFPSADMTDISSGIGIAKKLVSATENPVGSNTYDIVYELLIQNYGGTPITNVQARDTLDNINGILNHLSGSVSLISGPVGITVNPAYNGYNVPIVGDCNLLTAGSTLSNIPGQNTIKLQITCRIANILPGNIYNNQAYATATGLFGDALRDASTNGSNPDLNNNSKPDDVGENQPTPLLISVVAQTPPCASLNNILFNQNFGSGFAGLSLAVPVPVLGTGVTFPINAIGYTGTVTPPIGTETATVSDNANNANTSDFISLTDHTGGAGGRMLVVNADAASSTIYKGGFTYTLCANQQYSLLFYAAFVGNSSYQTVCDAFGGFKYAKIKMRIRDGGTGLIITEVSTDTIKTGIWGQYGLKFVSPASYSSLTFELINDAQGGCGNDLVIDDVMFGSCDPVLNVGVNSVAGCLGGISTFTGTLSDPSVIPGTKDYQWQWSPAPGTGPWTNIGGATSVNYTINPVVAADTGRYYRLLVSAAGNIATPSCRFTSSSTKLSGRIPSVAATSATKSKNNICPGIAVNLTAVGGSLGTNAQFKWYSGSPGGTLEGTGSSISVTPSVTTTYYVQAEGDCNTTAAQAVTVFVSCDIDKDKDGIPDYVESNMAAAFADANGNSVINAYDPTYAGFVDTNNDFINDNFQADGDSDNDGIPNYLDTTFPGRVDTNGDGIDDRFDKDLDGKINMLDLDSDNDGIPDVVEAYGVDTDGDGKIDNFTDTDGDGLSQNVDANNTGASNTGLGLGNIDMDADGVPNFLDLDSDNDGIPDIIETGAPDANNNGVVDVFADVNGNGFADAYEGAITAILKTGADVNNDGKADSYPNKNKDNDFRPNAYDLDSDNDGIPDVAEAYGVDTNGDGKIDNFTDADADGLSDNVDGYISGITGKGLGLPDFDADGVPNYLDLDSDNDGIPDILEAGAPDVNNDDMVDAFADVNNDGLHDAYINATALLKTGLDTDGDGKANSYPNKNNDTDFRPNAYDLDSDNDGIPDVVEAYGVDTDGDGKIDNFTDTDVDGLSDNADGYISGSTGKGLGLPDLDVDGVPNFIDLDSDNDGIPDIVETGAPDANNNGVVDVFTDANSNGFADAYEGAVNAILKTGTDGNNDGKADNYPNKNKDNDFRPNAYDMDSDGDGIIDFRESGLPDVDNNYVVDGAIGTNGWSNSASGLLSFSPRNSDADIYPDYLDIDDDNDGIPDNIEGQPTATYKLPGTIDTDGDGLVNTYDNVAGFGGTGIQFYDNDGDTKPDYLDLDTDGDGQADIKEGNDFNLNGFGDDLVTLTGLDTDGDGLDNRFDSLNSVTNLKGTSYMMGLNGSLTGDATPGARCTVQKKVPTQLDRDWRYVGSVLPVQFLNFTVNTQTTKALLSWVIQATAAIDYVEVERSLNNSTFIKAGIVTDAVKLNEPQSFGFSDDISAVNSDVIYYRLKVIGKAGDIKYSNVLVVRRSQSKTPLSIAPNPAHDYVSIKFVVEKAGAITIRLVDNTGKTVLQHNQLVSKGSNNIQLTNLEKYATGVYTLQVLINNEIVTQKLILNK